MPEQHKDKRASDEPPSRTVVGQFSDSRNAELAAQTALKNGFAVQLVDRTSVRVDVGSHTQHAWEVEGILAAYGATNLPGVRSSVSEGPDRIRLDQGGRVELVEEELQARPRTVVAGEVQIRKRVVRENVTIEVPVQREELLIERLPVERRPVDRADAVATDPLVNALGDRLRQMQPGEALRIPIVEEEIIVHKQPVVKNELVIGKRLVRDVQHFSDTIRREVAEVDRRGDVRVAEVEEHP